MTGFFQVDLDVLKRFADSLHRSDEHMNQALDAMKAVGDNARIGTDALDGAAYSFQDAWRYGMTQIHSMAQETSTGVGQVEAMYEEAERELSDLLNKVTCALGTER